MKSLKLAVLVFICFAGLLACTDNIKKTHELDTKYINGQLMRYESVGEAQTKDGQALNQLTLVGQPYDDNPTEVTTSQEVMVPGTAALPAPPTRPVYGRVAKAVPRTPPVQSAPPKKETLVKKTTISGPRVLATAQHGGNTTKHDTVAAVPGAVGNAVGMTTFGTTFGVAQRVGKNVINNTLAQQQGQDTKNKLVGINDNTNINPIKIDNSAIGTGIGTGTGVGTAASN